MSKDIHKCQSESTLLLVIFLVFLRESNIVCAIHTVYHSEWLGWGFRISLLKDIIKNGIIFS